MLSKILLPYQGISYGSLKPEQKICVEFVNDMRVMSLEGNLPYVWFHISNEFLPSARKNYSFDLKQKHMGKISGVPDYCFMSPKDCFFIEFKAGKGKLTENQVIFQEWCQKMSVEYFVCRSSEEGVKTVMDRARNIK